MIIDHPSSEDADPTPEPVAAQPISAEEVRAALHRILQSPEFQPSRRCHDFLSFVVEQTLAGLPNGLKERTIGVQVFGRPVTYDTNAEGIVRIKASEVRKRLAIYYAGPGKEENIRIELPVGSYVPNFYRLLVPEADKPAPEPVEEVTSLHDSGALPVLLDVAEKRPALPRRAWITGLGVMGVLLVAGTVSAWKWAHRPALERFWKPVLQSPEPLLVAADYAPIYLLRPLGGPRTPPSETTKSDFVLQTDQYLGGGDLVAASEVTGMLGRQGHAFTVRVGKGVSFEDLRGAPCVLIGYSMTRWSQLTKDFRFSFDDEGMIRDQGRPTPWYTHLTRENHTDMDYAIVSRAFLPQTHASMILISGSTQYGTESAANLVTNPELLEEAMQGAPKDWEHKNVQLVLQLRVIANTPGTPTVIASHFW